MRSHRRAGRHSACNHNKRSAIHILECMGIFTIRRRANVSRDNSELSRAERRSLRETKRAMDLERVLSQPDRDQPASIYRRVMDGINRRRARVLILGG